MKSVQFCSVVFSCVNRQAREFPGDAAGSFAFFTPFGRNKVFNFAKQCKKPQGGKAGVRMDRNYRTRRLALFCNRAFSSAWVA